MQTHHLHLLLADDDPDDCLLFEEAIHELNLNAEIQIVNNGDSLLRNLQIKKLPSILFLDLNMPGKTGFECLSEIRKKPEYDELPVIIISTSHDAAKIKKLQNAGAQHYICKPGEFEQLKSVIYSGLNLNLFNKDLLQHSDFVLQYK